MDFLNSLSKHKPSIMDIDYFLQSAIVIPIIKDQENTSILFEVRSKKLRGQPGEICFPGGKIEKSDINQQNAAIRETCEELGIKKTDLSIITPLDILITPHQLIIHPFVGKIRESVVLSPNNNEVDSVFLVPLQHFLDNPPQKNIVNVNMSPEENFPFQYIPYGKDYPWRRGEYPVYFYFFKEYVIWGLTARILHNFLLNYSKYCIDI